MADRFRAILPRFSRPLWRSAGWSVAAVDGIRPHTRAIRWHVLLMPLCFIPVVSYWIIGPAYISNWQTFILATVLNFSMTGGCVLTLNTLNKRVVHRHPDLDQTASRVWRCALVFLLVTPLFLLFGIFLYSHFHLFGYQHASGLTEKILLYNVGANVLSVGIEETVYSLTRWREMTIEREQLRKVTLQSQYESLKHQVNPHFLFNCLNSLSSLIADEPQQAERFVAEMAQVYRYLLQANSVPADATPTDSNDGNLTTLATELQFIRSYYHLLKTRYQAGIDLRVTVPTACQDYRLPPLTLQMLIENAIKHNVIATNRPLQLTISVTADQPAHLLVRNNLQPKATQVLSSQIGLRNITAKYQLLGQAPPVVRDDDGFFSVYLPLITHRQFRAVFCQFRPVVLVRLRRPRTFRDTLTWPGCRTGFNRWLLSHERLLGRVHRPRSTDRLLCFHHHQHGPHTAPGHRAGTAPARFFRGVRGHRQRCRHGRGHLLAIRYHAPERVCAGTFVYDFRFYSLILMGMVLLALSLRQLRAIQSLFRGHAGSQRMLIQAMLLTVAVSAPTGVFTPIGYAPAVACGITALALPFVRKRSPAAPAVVVPERVLARLTNEQATRTGADRDRSGQPGADSVAKISS